MATNPTKAGAVTLTDFAKSLDPNGSVAPVIELLNQNNECLQDILWKEGNLPTGHQTTVRTGLPSGTWRKLYQGVSPGKSGRAQITDTVGILEARSEIDVEVANLNGNTAAFRMSESEAFVEGLSHDMIDTLFYGDTSVNPERFHGLAARYNAISGGAPITENVISCGGSGSDNTSIWLVVWGENTITGIYPKGSSAGLDREDLGTFDAFDSNNARYRAVGDRYVWKAGLSVRDWRYAVRICNIDVSDLRAGTGTQAYNAATNIIDAMIRAMAHIPNMGKGRPVFYANRNVTTALPIMAKLTASNVLAVQPGYQQFGSVEPGFAGAGRLAFLGVPIRVVDRLLNTETVIS